jgi:uncharacterized protein (DUF2225 family)
MKVYKTVKVPATTRQVCINRKCDLCGLESTRESWHEGSYEINETEIKITIVQKNGSSFPEGGSGTEYEIDLCPDCFKGRFVPWLKSEGANINEVEWDY